MSSVFDMPAVILDTPRQIYMARLSAIECGLELEIKTGLRHSRNMILKAAQSETGKKTRKACLSAIKKLKEKEEKSWTSMQELITNPRHMKKH